MDAIEPRQRNESEPLRYEKNEQIQEDVCNKPIFCSRDEMKHSLTRLCYGNGYIIGSIWIQAMKSVLTGSKMCLVPPVEAAGKQKQKPKKIDKHGDDGDEPEKPENVGYEDLPMYGDEHAKYSEHQKVKHRCPNCNRKLLRETIQPTVSNVRSSGGRCFSCMLATIGALFAGIRSTMRNKKDEVLRFTRDPSKEKERKTFVRGSTLLAAYLGYRHKGRNHIHKGILWGGLAYLFTGWLCFPRETDSNFRRVASTISSALTQVYILFCGAPGPMLTYGPCEKDKPPLPKDKSKEQAKLCQPPKQKPPPKEKPVTKPPKRQECPPLYGAFKCPTDENDPYEDDADEALAPPPPVHKKGKEKKLKEKQVKEEKVKERKVKNHKVKDHKGKHKKGKDHEEGTCDCSKLPKDDIPCAHKKKKCADETDEERIEETCEETFE